MADAPAESDAVAPEAAVVVPFHRGRALLERVIEGVLASTQRLEIIVVANGHTESLDAIAAMPGVRVMTLPAACGPAIARNRGAAATQAPVLVFIDADVVPHPSAIGVLLDVLAREPDVAAVFGAYDHRPPHPGFYSQYRNLAHAFVHEQASREAGTFWAGLGAVRTEAFRAVGGFDERFTRPSIEDIDLGYRLRIAGHRLRLDVAARGTHLRGWTFRSSVRTDVRDRGVPWTQALLEYGALANDLNVSRRGRASVVSAYALASSVVATAVWTPAWPAVLLSLAAFAVAEWPLLRRFLTVRGGLFTLRVLAAQVGHHLCNGVSLVVGITLWAAQRTLGWRTSWTLPPDRWPPSKPGATSSR